MADRGDSDSEGNTISGVDEYIPDHFDVETANDSLDQAEATDGERPRTVPPITCLASLTKKNLKDFTSSGRRIRVFFGPEKSLIANGKW